MTYRTALDLATLLGITAGRTMTAREQRLDAECEDSPEPSVIYANYAVDADGAFVEYSSVTIVTRRE